MQRADAPDHDESLEAALSWLALTTHGVIYISVEQLARGRDVHYILSHETCHDVLLGTSAMGRQLEALSLFTNPPMPAGRLQRKARGVLREGMAASMRTQEGCATFLPSNGLAADDLAGYWRDVPAAYREYADNLEWLRGRELPREAVERIVFSIGRFALGCRLRPAELASPAATAAAMDDPLRNPDLRFEAACRCLMEASDAELRAIADAESPGELIARQWHPDAPVPHEPAWEGDKARWIEVITELASTWLTDKTLAPPERDMLTNAVEQPARFTAMPTYTTLKALLIQAEPVSSVVLDRPPVDRLLAHRLSWISFNGYPQDMPGIEFVDGRHMPLEADAAAMWVESPGLQPLTARLPPADVREYVSRVPSETTLCFFDGGYLFPYGDLFGEEMVRGRPHVVFLRNRSLGGFLRELAIYGELAGESSVLYSVIGSDIEGVSYMVIRPASGSYPAVIAPVPDPTANRAVGLIEEDHYEPLQWQAQLPPDMVRSNPGMFRHLARVFASFEGKPWMQGTY